MTMNRDLGVTKHLGLDLGGTNIKSCIIEMVNGKPRIIEQASVPTEADLGPESVKNSLVSLVKQKHQAFPDISSVAIGVPGTFDHETGVMRVVPNLAGAWDGFPLTELINAAVPFHVLLINDARAFSLAEATMGAANGKKVVACLVLGTGVGGGLIFNGAVHMGATFGAGEIAHQIVQVDGPLCGCGQHGCLEVFTSAAALCRSAGTSTPAEAYEKAVTGDLRSLKAFREMGEWLGLAVANLVTLLAPDVFVIGGGVAQAGDLLLNMIRASAAENLKLFDQKYIKIVPAELGTYAGSIGAALYGAINAGAKVSFISTT